MAEIRRDIHTYKVEEHPIPEMRDRMVKLVIPGGPHAPFVLYVMRGLLHPDVITEAGLDLEQSEPQEDGTSDLSGGVVLMTEVQHVASHRGKTVEMCFRHATRLALLGATSPTDPVNQVDIVGSTLWEPTDPDDEQFESLQCKICDKTFESLTAMLLYLSVTAPSPKLRSVPDPTVADLTQPRKGWRPPTPRGW